MKGVLFSKEILSNLLRITYTKSTQKISNKAYRKKTSRKKRWYQWNGQTTLARWGGLYAAH